MGASHHKYHNLFEQLKGEIEAGAYADGAKFDTEEALVKKYGLSRQTVRHALKLLEEEGLLRRVRGSGTFVTMRKTQRPTRTIGVVSTYISEYLFPSIIRGIDEVASAGGYTYKLSATGNKVDNERGIIKGYLENPVDGLIVEGTKTAFPNPNINLYEKLMASGVPIVFINGCYPQLDYCCNVVTDDYAGGYLLVEHLAELGHRRIGGIFKADDMQGHERYRGFMSALIAHDIEPHDDNITWFTTESRPLYHEGGNKELMESLSGCTAMVCYNDQIAVELLSMLTENGISIPNEMAVASFDNSIYATIASVKLTSLDHPKEELGRVAAQKLINIINGREEKSVRLPFKLVVRESTAGR